MKAPLIAHVVFRLEMGGMENGLVNLLDTMDRDRYRHAILCLKGAGEFARRLRRTDVEIVSLGKREGADLAMYGRFAREVRRLGADIVHTRNSGTLECLPVAALSGARHRVHGLHGWDVHDIDGTDRRHRLRQRIARPFVDRYVAVSKQLADWLHAAIGVPQARIAHICNGVDAARFRSPLGDGARRAVLPAGFAPAEALVIGAVGRMETVKDPLTLVRGFIGLADRAPSLRERLRLVYVGDGALRSAALALLARSGLAEQSFLPGARDDVPDLLRAFDVFVLPSLNEGISNTVLEAMASGLPVVATAVGGTPELVMHDVTGLLVPAGDPVALADALARYADAQLRARHGAAGRQRAEGQLSLRVMVEAYTGLYDSLLGVRGASYATGGI